MRIAVVGAGVAGIGAAWALSSRYDVTLFESEARAGGHATTVELGEGEPAVDTGFIVYNEPAYPNLVRFFAELGVATEPSDMSFSVSLDGGRFEYQARALGLLAQPRTLADPRHLRMIGEIVRFSREAPSLLGSTEPISTGEYLRGQGYSRTFTERFLLPMLACIWSSSLEAMLDHPATSMVAFLQNHGMLDLRHRPRWRTVSGGSWNYVRRAVASIGSVRTEDAVTRVRRLGGGVAVTTPAGEQRFDEIVLATHADDALAILGEDATREERDALAAFGYQDNLAVLHRDPSLMPIRRRAWSSWNYLGTTRSGVGPGPVSLTYWMNRLQNLRTRRPVFVSLNPSRMPRDVVRTQAYRHPRFDASAVAAQPRFASLQGADHVWFAGSYLGYGFHEDALRSGLSVAAGLDAPAPWWNAPILEAVGA